jgi:hypothetical protein
MEKEDITIQELVGVIEKGVITLSSLSKKKRALFEQDFEKKIMYNEQKPSHMRFVKPYSSFNEHGLRFDLQHLRDVKLMILLLPIEYMANYADKCTVTAVDLDDEEFTQSTMKSIAKIDSLDDERVLHFIDVTSIGKLAYIILNHKNQKFKTDCEAVLNRLHMVYLSMLIFVKEMQGLHERMNERIKN